MRIHFQRCSFEAPPQRPYACAQRSMRQGARYRAARRRGAQGTDTPSQCRVVKRSDSAAQAERQPLTVRRCGKRARFRRDQRRICTDFSSVYEYNSSSPRSRPNPLFLTPPKGIARALDATPLIHM